MLCQPGRHSGDRHQLAGVPEQVGEHHQASAGGEAPLQCLEHAGVGRLAARPGFGHREAGQGQPLALGQLPAGRHHPVVFGVADQQLIALLPGQAPEGKHTAARNVLGEGQPLLRHAAPAGQTPPQARQRASHIGPHAAGEGSELLDGAPARLDGFQGGGGQGALAAVVEIHLVGEGGHLAAQALGAAGIRMGAGRAGQGGDGGRSGSMAAAANAAIGSGGLRIRARRVPIRLALWGGGIQGRWIAAMAAAGTRGFTGLPEDAQRFAQLLFVP